MLDESGSDTCHLVQPRKRACVHIGVTSAGLGLLLACRVAATMKVDTACLQPLLGQREDEISFHALCSESGMTESKRWFDASVPGGPAGQWRETHLLDFLRTSTDLGDKQILDVFDLLDPEGRGAIGFAEFYFLVLLLLAIKEVY